jgi:hypothetical protein
MRLVVCAVGCEITWRPGGARRKRVSDVHQYGTKRSIERIAGRPRRLSGPIAGGLYDVWDSRHSR